MALTHLYYSTFSGTEMAQGEKKQLKWKRQRKNKIIVKKYGREEKGGREGERMNNKKRLQTVIGKKKRKRIKEGLKNKEYTG